jgi:hypothetical protein
MFMFEGFLAGRTMIFRQGFVNRKFGGREADGLPSGRCADGPEGKVKEKEARHLLPAVARLFSEPSPDLPQTERESQAPDVKNLNRLYCTRSSTLLLVRVPILTASEWLPGASGRGSLMLI